MSHSLDMTQVAADLTGPGHRALKSRFCQECFDTDRKSIAAIHPNYFRQRCLSIQNKNSVSKPALTAPTLDPLSVVEVGQESTAIAIRDASCVYNIEHSRNMLLGRTWPREVG